MTKVEAQWMAHYQRNKRKYFKNLYFSGSENFKAMEKFQDIYELSKLIQ